MPEELTDEAGEIVWECSYQLWGKPIQEIAHTQIQQNLRYQGQYLDRETGLHYNTFRYYNPDTDRFTMPDPIGLAGGLNLYQYAPNALTWIDPWGLRQTFCGKAQNRSVRHSSRKKAKDAAAHAHHGRKRPTPPKHPPHNASNSEYKKWKGKKDRYKQQQRYKKPESHRNSKHPEPHFHEGQKPDINTIGIIIFQIRIILFNEINYESFKFFY